MMLLDHKPPITNVFLLVVYQERQMNKDANEEIKVLANSSFNLAAKKRGKGKMCTHCGKAGQTLDVCYKKHGFPPGHIT